MTATFGREWSAGLRRADRSTLDAWLDFALECCDVADEIAIKAFRAELAVTIKPDGSFVTQADTTIESTIRAALTERFPDDGIVGEEYGTVDSASSTTTRWYLDPIDGTHNFMRRVPLFGTLLAVEHDGELQAGVVSAPAMGQRWWATRGGGAWTTGGGGGTTRPIQVSGEEDLGAAQVLYRSLNDMHASRVSPGFDALLPGVWRERGFGDFWGYMLVADGAAEAMMEQDLGPWDLAAPWLVVEEAGGRITDFDGRRSLEKGESLATNGLLHETLLHRLWQRA
jgi:histidinol-phosphatase